MLKMTDTIIGMEYVHVDNLLADQLLEGDLIEIDDEIVTVLYLSGTPDGITVTYENEYGDVVHSSYAGTKSAISNLDYETTLNEARRNIIMLKPVYVAKFVDSFNNLIING